MENASRALLIAASILIAVLLIAFGMRIFNQSAEPAGQLGAAMDSTQIAAFNSKFLKYSGTQSGSRIKALANEVMSHNATTIPEVKFQGETSATGIIGALESVDSMKSYKVTIQDINPAEGLIDTITFALAGS